MIKIQNFFRYKIFFKNISSKVIYLLDFDWTLLTELRENQRNTSVNFFL